METFAHSCMCKCLSFLTQQISTVLSMGVSSERGLQDAAQLVGDNPVDITERDVFDVKQPTADPVHRVVLVHEDRVWQLVKMSQR